MAALDASAPSIGDARRPRQPAWWKIGVGDQLEQWLETERDQLALWLPVGLLAGIAFWFWSPDRPAWIGWIAGSVGVALATIAAVGWTRLGKAISLFALAAALGCGLIWWKAERAAAPRLERPGMVSLVGWVERVQPMPAEQTVRLLVAPQSLRRRADVAPMSSDALPARLRINVDEEMARGVEAGALVRIGGWMMPPPRAAVPGSYDFSRMAWFSRIGGTGRASELERIQATPSQSLSARLAGARNRLAEHIRGSLEGDAQSGIAAALATGDQHGIPDADIEAMRRSGLAHLLSVSGLHLTAVVGAVMFLVLKLLALSPTLALRLRLVVIAAGAGAAAGIAYTLLTGAEVPTIRACIAALLVLAGLALGRDALTLRLVATGAVVVLLLWPETAAGASFQLSFAAIIAIVALHEHPRIRALLARREEATVARIGRVLAGLVLTGLAVEFALAPIALFHFHKAGLYGAAANIVAIPLTTFIIMPLEGLALLFDVIGIGAPFWWLAGQALGLLLSIAHAAAAAPGAVALVPLVPVGAFAIVVAGGLWICLWRTRWRRLGLIPIVVGAFWALASPAPDLLVTADGRHLAVRTPSDGVALLRPRAGEFVRETLAEASGIEPRFGDLEAQPFAACSADLCAFDVRSGNRSWRILATRTSEFVRWDQMVRACAEADIVVADRRLPRFCRPRWLKADRALLDRTGGLAVHFGDPPRILAGNRQGDHPWAR